MDARSSYSLARREVSWPVVASGLWLRLAFVAVSLAAYGIATFASGEMGLPSALFVIFASLAVTALALRRSYQVLGTEDGEPDATPSARPAPMRTREA